MLYNITFSLYDTSKRLIPYIPYSAASDEDQKTERVCFSDSIEGCITAIGSCNRDLYTHCQIVVRSVDEQTLDPSKIVTPQELYNKRKVPDALETGEHWYLDDVRVQRDVYEVMDFNYEYAIAFTCLEREDMAHLIAKYDSNHPLMRCESIEQAYNRVVGQLQQNGMYDESDAFEDEVAALPWAQRIKVTELKLRKVEEAS